MMTDEVRLTPSRRVITCRHCGKRRLNRRAGLCWACAKTTGATYPSTSKFVRTGNGATNAVLPPPAMPTAYRPGTVGKLAVMAQRLARGEHLHHPQDERS